jgi:hypothetical protein
MLHVMGLSLWLHVKSSLMGAIVPIRNIINSFLEEMWPYIDANYI